jgi:hypothetical protein
MTGWKPIGAMLLSVVVMASSVIAHEPTSSTPAQEEAGTSVPLYDDLGDLTYPITATNTSAQRYFDQGLRLTYAFNHGEALRAFRAAQQLDPNCAMCYWGEAFVLGPNINAPMDDAAGNPAVVAITKAQALAPQAKAHEQALIHALAKRYARDPNAERAALDRAYADAMAEAARRFPDDDEIAVLCVDSLMNLSPWDYWEADGATPKGRIGDAIRRGALEYLGETYLAMGCLAQANATLARLETVCKQTAADGAVDDWKSGCEEWQALKAAIDSSCLRVPGTCQAD